MQLPGLKVKTCGLAIALSCVAYLEFRSVILIFCYLDPQRTCCNQLGRGNFAQVLKCISTNIYPETSIFGLLLKLCKKMDSRNIWAIQFQILLLLHIVYKHKALSIIRYNGNTGAKIPGTTENKVVLNKAEIY